MVVLMLFFIWPDLHHFLFVLICSWVLMCPSLTILETSTATEVMTTVFAFQMILELIAEDVDVAHLLQIIGLAHTDFERSASRIMMVLLKLTYVRLVLLLGEVLLMWHHPLVHLLVVERLLGLMVTCACRVIIIIIMAQVVAHIARFLLTHAIVVPKLRISRHGARQVLLRMVMMRCGGRARSLLACVWQAAAAGRALHAAELICCCLAFHHGGRPPI